MESKEKPNDLTKESSTAVPSTVAGLKRQRVTSLRAASSNRLNPEDLMMVVFVTFPSELINISIFTEPSSSSLTDALGYSGLLQTIPTALVFGGGLTDCGVWLGLFDGSVGPGTFTPVGGKDGEVVKPAFDGF